MRNASAVAGDQPRWRSSSAAVAASHLWGRGRPGAMAGSDAIFLGNPAKTLQILTACYIGPMTICMYSVVQINVVKCFMTSIMHHATFDHVCLDRRVVRDGASISTRKGVVQSVPAMDSFVLLHATRNSFEIPQRGAHL